MIIKQFQKKYDLVGTNYIFTFVRIRK